jgi:RNA polymerase sigma-70 factor, ECF subfamily
MKDGASYTDENDLISRIVNGETGLYSVIVESYRQMVFRTCMGYVHDHEEAQDLAQDIFINAYSSLKLFRKDSSFSTWLYRIAVNACLNAVRKNRRHLQGGIFTGLFSGLSVARPDNYRELTDTDDPETIIIRNEHRQWLQDMVDSLPELQRTAFILSKYDELSQKEIAEIMETTEGAVEALLQRAKMNLRKKIQASLKKKHE